MIYSNTEEFLDLATYCYNKLGLVEEVRIELKPLSVHGYCYEDGLVEINEALSTKDKEITICHEMVHCAQYEQQGRTCEEEAYRLEQQLWREYKMKLSRTGNGYLEDPSVWSLETMHQMAIEDEVELTDSMVTQIEKAREYYSENSKVPPIRTFAKYVGIDKGKLFKEWLTGPMKPITKYGGLPQPTGCV